MGVFMVTKVGLQSDLAEALKDLLELEYDAFDAYEVSIKRLDNQGYIEKMQEFLDDHKRHIKQITAFLRDQDIEFSPGPSATKQWITKGKVILADMVGDNTILAAMHSNEEDTNTAYERMSLREDLDPDIQYIIASGLEDERKHMAWLKGISIL